MTECPVCGKTTKIKGFCSGECEADYDVIRGDSIGGEDD